MGPKHPDLGLEPVIDFFLCHAITYGMSIKANPYPSDVIDAEWSFLLPFLTLIREDAPQRRYDLRAVFDGGKVAGQDGLPLAVSAPRLSALDSGLPAGAPLAGNGRVRADCP